MKLKTIEILLFYDQAHLLTASGENQEIYLCLLVEMFEDGTNMYIGTPISKSRLSLLVTGQIDVRLVYTKPENVIFLQISESKDGLLIGNELAIEAIPEEYLPEADLFLSDPLESAVLSGSIKFTEDPKSKTRSTPARFTGEFSLLENEFSIYYLPPKPAQNGKIKAERNLVFR
ncbi:DUF6575 domain-containing protein [Dyadobacter arcticus]|uniref:DUF6575 domain-containing protein n=1 Tax=Dyadobacter arcticus TaxID=1078754 RepID=A0ABX0UP23_9BACT|nr:DUF6575 domain-containing protein [Dyadobacter arcticus]NIJ54716.1 hypothetical protein [Dyadobacter arcticus]